MKQPLFRVFGSPYTPSLHQHVTYLRLKGLPFRVYCSTFTTTLLYSIFYRARNAFCATVPSGRSCLQFWQLAELSETGTAHCQAARAGEERTPLLAEVGSLALSRASHPQLHLVGWAVVLYASWWLVKVGAMFRWVHSTSTNVIQGYLNYFLLLGGVSISGAVASRFREAMQRILAVTGVSKETEEYMVEHFERMCEALDIHFKEHPDVKHLLCTPHPTLADVALGAAFSGYFLMDDPPMSALAEKWPHLYRYLEHITGMKDGQLGARDEEPILSRAAAVHVASDVAGMAAVGPSADLPRPLDGAFPDHVPQSLSPFLDLIVEVLPFMMSQCAAFNAYVAGDGVRELSQCTLEAPWEGCTAYLLPQITSIKSLNIIDNGVFTVNARAQDLELALLAAREVTDLELDSFNRAKASVSAVSALDVAAPGHTARHEPPSGEANGALGVAEQRLAVNPTNSSPCEEHVAAEQLAELAMDNADFHRVFTKRGSRLLRTVQLKPTARISPASHLLHSTPVESTVSAIQRMLTAMHNPHYTLASVFHGRKMYVAAIPECEVDKIRSRCRKSK